MMVGSQIEASFNYCQLSSTNMHRLMGALENENLKNSGAIPKCLPSTTPRGGKSTDCEVYIRESY